MTTSRHCELCGTMASLRQSHVIPAFVPRWLRETSPGMMRTVTQPNQRIQDGPTREWLCDICEQRFSDWEKPFSETVFQYVHNTSEDQRPVSYSDWALKFATSMSWRTLRYYRDSGNDHLSDADAAHVEKAERVWRELLLGQRTHPGEFEQHVILVDTLANSSTAPVSPFLNRYFLRTMQLDIVASKSMCFTYAKLCRVIIIGFIRVEAPRRWKGTKLHVRSGFIGGDCEVPQLLFTYWNDKANQTAAALASLSEKQQKKLDEMFANADLDALAESEVLRAMHADVQFSGDLAFSSTGRPTR